MSIGANQNQALVKKKKLPVLYLATKVVKSLNANLARGPSPLCKTPQSPQRRRVILLGRRRFFFFFFFQQDSNCCRLGLSTKQIRLIRGPEIAAEQLRLSGDTQSKGCDVELANQANHERPRSQINHIQASRLTWLSSISALCSTLHPEGRFFLSLPLSLPAALTTSAFFQRYVLAPTQIIGIKSLNVTFSAHL